MSKKQNAEGAIERMVRMILEEDDQEVEGAYFLRNHARDNVITVDENPEKVAVKYEVTRVEHEELPEDEEPMEDDDVVECGTVIGIKPLEQDDIEKNAGNEEQARPVEDIARDGCNAHFYHFMHDKLGVDEKEYEQIFCNHYVIHVPGEVDREVFDEYVNELMDKIPNHNMQFHFPHIRMSIPDGYDHCLEVITDSFLDRFGHVSFEKFA